MTMMFPGVEVLGVGAVAYTPQRAPESKGFGPYEVHPQRLPKESAIGVGLEHNGEWLILLPPELTDDTGRRLRYLAVTVAMGGRETAERIAAFRNGDVPTRVVDLGGVERTSRHSRSSVAAEAKAKGVEIPLS